MGARAGAETELFPCNWHCVQSSKLVNVIVLPFSISMGAFVALWSARMEQLDSDELLPEGRRLPRLTSLRLVLLIVILTRTHTAAALLRHTGPQLTKRPFSVAGASLMNGGRRMQAAERN